VLHIPDSVLDLVGLGGATEVDLSTDTGRRLVIQATAPMSPPGQPAPAGVRSGDFDPENPKESARLIAALESLGLDLRYFKKLHHAGDRASLVQHRKYCENTNRFTSSTNVTVAKRLKRVLELRRGGKGMDEAVAVAVDEFPFR